MYWFTVQKGQISSSKYKFKAMLALSSKSYRPFTIPIEDIQICNRELRNETILLIKCHMIYKTV